MHVVYQVQHTMGVQQHTNKNQRPMEGSLPHPRRTLQTNSHVLRAYKFPYHLSNNDEHHILETSDARMAFSIHG